MKVSLNVPAISPTPFVPSLQIIQYMFSSLPISLGRRTVTHNSVQYSFVILTWENGTTLEIDLFNSMGSEEHWTHLNDEVKMSVMSRLFGTVSKEYNSHSSDYWNHIALFDVPTSAMH